MKQLRLKIVNDLGLHARPAALFVKEANQHKAGIRVRNATTDSKWVDAKSILSVLTLGVEKDHEIDLTIEGLDEAEAAANLERLIRSDFADPSH